jgi:hypothetical protein
MIFPAHVMAFGIVTSFFKRLVVVTEFVLSELIFDAISFACLSNLKFHNVIFSSNFNVVIRCEMF